MFRLIKLAIYAVAGYALYQFYLGMTEQGGQFAGSFGGQQGGNQGKDQGNENFGDVGGARMTGGGEGIQMKTEEASGLSVSNRVGRGVIPR